MKNLLTVVAATASTATSQAIFSMDEADVPILTDESFLGFDMPPPTSDFATNDMPPPSIAQDTTIIAMDEADVPPLTDTMIFTIDEADVPPLFNESNITIDEQEVPPLTTEQIYTIDEADVPPLFDNSIIPMDEEDVPPLFDGNAIIPIDEADVPPLFDNTEIIPINEEDVPPLFDNTIIPMDEEDVPPLFDDETMIIPIDEADVQPLLDRRRRYDFAACRVEANPTNPNNIAGKVVLAQDPLGGPVWIRADLKGLPYPQAKYAFAINEVGWDGQDCASAGGHFNPTDEYHGKAGESPSHVGDLQQLTSNFGGSVKYFQQFSKPMLSGLHSVVGRSIAVYENEDDLGRGGYASSLINGNAGRILGCCNIMPLQSLDSLEKLLGIQD